MLASTKQSAQAAVVIVTFALITSGAPFVVPFAETASAQATRSHPTMHVRFPAWTPQVEATLRNIPHIDITLAKPPAYIEALIFPTDLPVLTSLGLKPTVLHADLEAHYREHLKQPGANTLKLGSMGGYMTLAEILAQLDQWRTQYPGLITARQSIGKSIENRDQWVVKISANADTDENEPEMWVESLIHCREPISMMSMMRCIEYMLERYGKDSSITDLLDNREIWYLPVFNVDGYEYNRRTNPNGGGLWRKNRRLISGSTYGIDLNRNFGYQWGYDNRGSSGNPGSATYRGASAFSEPEAQNVRNFINSRLQKGMTMAWDVHCYSGLCMFPWGYANLNSPRNAAYTELSNDLASKNKYTTGTVYRALYPINGGAVDWFEGTAGLWGWLPELGWSSDGFWPPTSRILALTEENLHMLLTAIKYAGPYLITKSKTIREVGNNDGNYDPGEKFEVTVTVRNRGVVTANSAVVRLVSQTPYAVVEVGQAPLGTLANVTDGNNNAAPLRARIPAFTPAGTRIKLDIEYVFNGHTIREPVDIIVGKPTVVVNDTCETASWTRGVAGDTAVRGIWTWGNPNPTYATSRNRFAVQTGDDNTPSGVNCYITGNQITTNGNADDVDGGKTTLVTPALNLATAINPYIEYARWYVDHGPTPNNDVFTVEVSNDGTTWTTVETVTYTDQAWRTTRFRLRDYVKPSAQVRLRFVATDQPDDSYCEALVDDLKVTDYDDGVRISLSGSPRIGQTTNVDLVAAQSANLPYAVGASFGDQVGIPIAGGRTIPLDADPLFFAAPLLPAIFQNFRGGLSGSGQGQAQIAIPANAGLVGARIHTAFITLLGSAPSGVRDVSPSTVLAITP